MSGRTMRSFKPWCKWHFKTVNNPDGTDCIVHVVEGRKPFLCRFRSLALAKRGHCADAELESDESKIISAQASQLATQFVNAWIELGYNAAGWVEEGTGRVTLLLCKETTWVTEEVAYRLDRIEFQEKLVGAFVRKCDIEVELGITRQVKKVVY